MKLLGRVASSTSERGAHDGALILRAPEAMKYRTCLCCHPRSLHRFIKRSARRKEDRIWKKETRMWWT